MIPASSMSTYSFDDDRVRDVGSAVYRCVPMACLHTRSHEAIPTHGIEGTLNLNVREASGCQQRAVIR